MRFVDTNVLLYSVSTAAEDRSKLQTALSLLDSKELVLSVQVLQEFYIQATRNNKPGQLTHEQAILLIESFLLRYPVQAMTVSLMRSALAAKERYRIAYWDAAVIAAARADGSDQARNEDL